MKKLVWLVGIIVLCIVSLIALKTFANNQASLNKGDKGSIIVEIDYGEVRPLRSVEIPFVKGRTALETLQSIAKVETHPVGQYVFVVSIDDVEGKRGEMGWYYTVDGKSSDKLAYSNVLNNMKEMRWIYKKDTCSEKVDKI